MYTARHTQLRALQARKQCLLDVDVEGGDHREHQNSRENIKTSCSSMQQFYYYFFFSLRESRVVFVLVDSGIRFKVGCYLTESNHDVQQQTAFSDKDMKKSKGRKGQGWWKTEGVGWGGPLLPMEEATPEIQDAGYEFPDWLSGQGHEVWKDPWGSFDCTPFPV